MSKMMLFLGKRFESKETTMIIVGWLLGGLVGWFLGCVLHLIP